MTLPRTLPIRNITAADFKKYGTVLEHTRTDVEYEPIVTVASRGWIWAMLTFDWKSIKSIQNHPTSKESFEPVFGTTVLVVAPKGAPEQLQAFLLDVPVLLDEGVWHQVLALSATARVKITENNDVTSENLTLDTPLTVQMVS
ncbi:MAG: hypothetical protein E4H01_14000 [Lysobacterales bacterium]|nr:MAG: hypothetical protein E4H01_14000 [Xanthomonadales bacterium]